MRWIILLLLITTGCTLATGPHTHAAPQHHYCPDKLLVKTNETLDQVLRALAPPTEKKETENVGTK